MSSGSQMALVQHAGSKSSLKKISPHARKIIHAGTFDSSVNFSFWCRTFYAKKAPSDKSFPVKRLKSFYSSVLLI